MVKYRLIFLNIKKIIYKSIKKDYIYMPIFIYLLFLFDFNMIALMSLMKFLLNANEISQINSFGFKKHFMSF